MRVFWLGCCLLASAVGAWGQGDREIDKKVTEFTLGNGLRFVILERHQAPVIAFHTYVEGGAVDDPPGQSGLSGLLARLAFKGSESIGTKNWPEEKKALDAIDEAWDRLEAERNKGARMDAGQVDTLRTQWRLAVDTAIRYGDPAEYIRILQENGAKNPKAISNPTSLLSGYTLPSNRIELWFYMESQRLMHPVLRDFDKERSILIEEQNKAQNNIERRVIDALLGAAFVAHPFRAPATGWPSDLPELKRSEGRAYLEKHYVPGNIVMAMVGDVDPGEAKRLAEKYFGPMPQRPLPPRPHTMDPPQSGPRTVQLDANSQLLGVLGYKRPSYFDKDDAALDVLLAILGHGKGGMAWRELVEEKKLATGLQVTASYPDGRYPNLFLIFYAPAPGHSVEEVQKGIEDMLARFRLQKVPDDALNDAEAQAQSRAYQQLTSNEAAAEMLAVYTGAYGDWKRLFRTIEETTKVTADDVLRVAQRYLHPANRTSVYTAIPGTRTRGGLQ